MRFSEQVIRALLDWRWWDRPIEELAPVSDYFIVHRPLEQMPQIQPSVSELDLAGVAR
jgi:hypothetical protein